MEWVIHFAAAREMTISYSLRRHFWWHNNNLWLEDVPSHIGIVVGVSSNDEIVPAQSIYEYTNMCRAQRLETRQRSKVNVSNKNNNNISSQDLSSCAQVDSKRIVTRSLKNLLATAVSFSSFDNIENNEITETDQSKQVGRLVKQGDDQDVAMIECVMWDGYSHGQILLPTQCQFKFVDMVRHNEKRGLF